MLWRTGCYLTLQLVKRAEFLLSIPPTNWSTRRTEKPWYWAHPWWNPSGLDRKSTRLNSSHLVISYAVFCLKKKQTEEPTDSHRRDDKEQLSQPEPRLPAFRHDCDVA